MTTRSPVGRSDGVSFPTVVADFGTYLANVGTIAQFAPPAAAGLAGWFDIGPDFSALLFSVLGGTKGAHVLIETAEVGPDGIIHPDKQTIEFDTLVGGAGSYEIFPVLRRCFRVSANSNDPGFALTQVDIQIKGIRYQF